MSWGIMIMNDVILKNLILSSYEIKDVRIEEQH